MSKFKPGPPPETAAGKAGLMLKRWVAASCAMSAAEVTLPLDTAKVQLQIQGNAPPGSAVGKPYKNLADVLIRMARSDGLTGLYRGLGPAVSRQVVYGGLRLSMYDYVRDFYHNMIQGGEGNPWMATKILAGLSTGAMAMCVAQPTDVIKIRFQAEKGRYKSPFDAVKQIVAADGVAGLWRGLGPNVTRNATMTACQLATYDQIKETLVQVTGMDETSSKTHFSAALTAGFISVAIGSPIDVVKTRIMNSKPDPVTGALPYRSTPHAFMSMAREEGIGSFYKGFIPNYVRMGSWMIVMFLTYEQIKLNFAEPLNYQFKE